MLLATVLAATAVLSLLPSSLAYPGMEKALAEIKARQDADGGNRPDDGDSTELLGNLRTLPESQLTATGKDIKLLLQGGGDPQSKFGYNAPPLGSSQCKQDTCCVWKYIADEMAKAFKGNAGRCNNLARACVRLGFHDAGAWSKDTASQGGGADGSICLTDEVNRADNNGLQGACKQMNAWYDKWHTKYKYPVSMADLIQMGATTATVVCPLGPRIRTFTGRPDVPKANPPNLLPGPFDTAPSLLALFAAKTISPHGLVALVGSHTTSQQQFVNASRAGDPQDSTPGVWDVKFYGEVLGSPRPPKRVFQFQSDINLSEDPRTEGEWRAFAGPGGQEHWNEDFAREYIRLSLLGVEDLNGLTECTKVLPGGTPAYAAPDQANLDKWLGSEGRNEQSDKIAGALLDGDSIVDSLIDALFGWLKLPLGGLFGV